MKRYVIAVYVENKYGVVARVSGLFMRRGFNIDSLEVGVTEDPERSRMTITMTGEDYDRDQIIKQLEKLQDVFVVREMIPETIVSRELILIKVATTSANRQEIIDAVNIFRNKIIDFTPDSLCIEATGETSKIEAFIELVRQYGIIELCRTGTVSLDRGTKSLTNNN